MSTDRFESQETQDDIADLNAKTTSQTALAISYPANTYSNILVRSAKRYGNIIHVNFTASLSGSLSGSNAVVCTLPVGCRPSAEVYTHIFGTYGNNKDMYNVAIQPNGEVLTKIGSGSLSGTITLEATLVV